MNKEMHLGVHQSSALLLHLARAIHPHAARQRDMAAQTQMLPSADSFHATKLYAQAESLDFLERLGGSGITCSPSIL